MNFWNLGHTMGSLHIFTHIYTNPVQTMVLSCKYSFKMTIVIVKIILFMDIFGIM